MYAPIEYIESYFKDKFDEVYNDSIKDLLKLLPVLSASGIPVQYITSEKQLANNARTSTVSKSEFIRALLPHNKALINHLPDDEQPLLNWTATTYVTPEAIDDGYYDKVVVKFSAKISTSKKQLINLAYSALKEKVPSIIRGITASVHFLECDEDFNRSFEVYD